MNGPSKFSEKTAVTATGLSLTPLIRNSYSSVLGQNAPSNKIKVALIGCRNIGWSKLKAFFTIPRC